VTFIEAKNYKFGALGYFIRTVSCLGDGISMCWTHAQQKQMSASCEMLW